MSKSRNVAAGILAALLVSSSTAVLAGSVYDNGGQTDPTPLADRAATLGGQTFKVERVPADAAGFVSRHGTASADSTSENPLADRAATLDGKAFTVESAGDAPHAVERGNDAEANRAFGTPLKDRAEILGGQTFTVERTQTSPRTESFLARF
jgi:hypothetical protein